MELAVNVMLTDSSFLDSNARVVIPLVNNALEQNQISVLPAMLGTF